MHSPLFRHCAATALSAGIALAAGAAAAQPDLVPQLNNPMNATVSVQNTGTSASGPSHLIINCTKFGQVDGGCPDAPGMGAYVDPAYPNRVVIDVPALAPNQFFNHDVTFWDSIPWVPGTFVFDAEVDPGNDVAESNEANNTTQSSYTQQPGSVVSPPDPLPLTAKPAPAKPVQPGAGRLDSTTIFQLKKTRPNAAPPSGPQRLSPKQPDAPERLQLRTPGK